MKSAGSHCGCEEEDDKKTTILFPACLHLSAAAENACTAPHWHLPSLWVTLQCAHEPIYVSVLLPLYTLTHNLGGPKVSQWSSSAVTNSSEVTEVSALTSDTEA